ncbi:MAG TPA: hypothetical protein VIG57_08460, partial [Candidatus Entotheonella sp.]
MSHSFDQELQAILERNARFQAQVARLRLEVHPANYHAAASGFLADIDRMQLEVREYLNTHPTELEAGSQHIGETREQQNVLPNKDLQASAHSVCCASASR